MCHLLKDLGTYCVNHQWELNTELKTNKNDLYENIKFATIYQDTKLLEIDKLMKQQNICTFLNMMMKICLQMLD